MRRHASNVTRVPFDEFSSNVKTFFERVLRDHETVVVEDAGNAVLLTPVRKAKRRRAGSAGRTKADRAAFLSSFGGWSDVDDEEFVERVYEGRSAPSRSPVEL
ncbi:MAG: hypothetical protein WCD37_06020 [Chloroflexia bacterium]